MTFERDKNSSIVIYDKDTLDKLEQRRDDMLSGKVKTYTLKQTVEHIRQHRYEKLTK